MTDCPLYRMTLDDKLGEVKKNLAPDVREAALAKMRHASWHSVLGRWIPALAR